MPALLAGVTSVLAAHDLFLTLAAYFVPVNADVRVVVLNGTFSTSENSIDRPRIVDLSLVTPGGRRRLDTTQVSADGPRTAIRIHTESAGTYLAGMSLKPSEISLSGKQFNDYLKEEGLESVLAARRTAGELARPAKERYAKHVKIVFQAGPARSGGWSTVLGYPVEIVPLENPYELRPGDTLRVRLLAQGAALPAGQEVLAGGRTGRGMRRPVQHLFTGADGTAAVVLGPEGTWYVKFIRMTRATEPGLDYVSQWATLTFAVSATPGKGP